MISHQAMISSGDDSISRDEFYQVMNFLSGDDFHQVTVMINVVTNFIR
jgi:hypothetical protein